MEKEKLKEILLEESKKQLNKANDRLQGLDGDELEKAILVKNTWIKVLEKLAYKPKARGISERDMLFIAEIAKDINNTIRKVFQQEASNVPVSKEAIENRLIYQLDPQQSWKRWKKARLEAGWKLGPYDQEKKTHPNLIEDYNLLPFSEKVKDYTFFAVVETARRILAKERTLF